MYNKTSKTTLKKETLQSSRLKCLIRIIRNSYLSTRNETRTRTTKWSMDFKSILATNYNIRAIKKKTYPISQQSMPENSKTKWNPHSRPKECRLEKTMVEEYYLFFNL